MPEQFDPNWEYYEPDPEIAELMSADKRICPLAQAFPSCNGFLIRDPRDGGRPPRKTAQKVVCAECGKNCPRGNTLYCSKVCMGNGLVKRRSFLDLIPKRCAGCRLLFVTVFKTKRYCTTHCRPSYYNDDRTRPHEVLTVTVDEAKFALEKGVLWGEVFPLVQPRDDETLEALKAWYCRTKVLPNKKAREDAANPKSYGFTGSRCTRCGSDHMVRAGACERCEDCGETSGCG